MICSEMPWLLLPVGGSLMRSDTNGSCGGNIPECELSHRPYTPYPTLSHPATHTKEMEGIMSGAFELPSLRVPLDRRSIAAHIAALPKGQTVNFGDVQSHPMFDNTTDAKTKFKVQCWCTPQ